MYIERESFQGRQCAGNANFAEIGLSTLLMWRQSNGKTTDGDTGVLSWFLAIQIPPIHCRIVAKARPGDYNISTAQRIEGSACVWELIISEGVEDTAAQ